MARIYANRSSAIRAARAAARNSLGPYFQAAEGHDFVISPEPPRPDDIWETPRASFALRGPAANPTPEEQEAANLSWARARK